jgi:elongation factor P
MSKISASEIRPGQFLSIDNQLWRVLKLERQKPGKGGAFMQTSTKSIKDISKEYRFRTDESVELAILKESNGRFLYAQGNEYHFMDLDTTEIIAADKSSIHMSIGKDSDGLSKSDMELRFNLVDSESNIMLLIYDETLLAIELPAKVDCVVESIVPSSGGTKVVEIKGNKIAVPSYIELQELITINLSDLSFVRRAKKS